MQVWVMEELESSDIGDERLDQRFQLLLDTLSQRPSVSIPAACNGWAETQAAYRFFGSDRVDEESVLYPHRQATLGRIEQHEIVLLVQDTTEIDVTRPEQQMEGAGPLNDEAHLGFYDHVMLEVTPDRIPLGVVDVEIWARDSEVFEENKKLGTQGKQNKRRKAPIEEKESFRWLNGYREACAVAAETPQTTIVCISDSEGDIYECFAEAATACNEGLPTAEWIGVLARIAAFPRPARIRICRNFGRRWLRPKSVGLWKSRFRKTEHKVGMTANGSRRVPHGRQR